MIRQYELIVVTTPDADVSAIKRDFNTEISKIDGITLNAIEQTDTLGMSGKDIVLSFVISVVASFTVNMFQEQLEDALRNAGHEIIEEIVAVGIELEKVIDAEIAK